MAQVAHLDTRVADATLAMFEKYIGSLFTKARSKDERRFQATRRDVAKALLLFRRTIAALKRAKQAGEDGVVVVEREVGMAQLDRALPTIEAVADVADQDILLTAAEKYSVLRRFSPRFLASFQVPVQRRAGPGACRHRGDQSGGPVGSKDLRQAPARLLPVSEVAQADLRQRPGGATPLRNGGPGRPSRPLTRGGHLGGRQPRLPRIRRLSHAG